MFLRGAKLIAVVAGLAAAPALAEPNAFLVHLMGRKPHGPKTFACFVRTYDPAYLDAHPDQNITYAEALAVSYENHDFALQLRLGFRLRGRPEIFSSVGECGTRASVRRGARCSGLNGPMWIALEGKKSLLMRLPKGSDLWRPGPPDPGNALKGAFGPDDILFRIDRVDLAQCADQMFDYERKELLGGGK
jgi:hypothetical protein